MNVSVKKLDKSEVELTITVPYAELAGFLDSAAAHISQEFKFDGFRPGKAPRHIVEKRVGKQAVLEEAVNLGLPRFYTDAIIQEKIEAVGTPHINVTKVAPDNDLEFVAKIGVMPEVKLPDYAKIKVAKAEVKEDTTETDKALDYLRKSRAKYNEVDRAAATGDRVWVDFTMSIDKVPTEDGVYTDHPLVIGEGMIVKGFEDQLVGLKKDDKKQFQLEFPKDHFKKDIAGKKVDFDVTMKKVELVEMPALDDAFAKTLGKFETMDELRAKLGSNIKAENEQKEHERVESELLEKISDQTDVVIPEVIIESEIEKMLGDMRAEIQSMGGNFEDYLASTKKSLEDLKKDLRKQAEGRAKTALVIREIAKREEVEATPKELEEEINKILVREGHHPDIKKRVLSFEFKEYVSSIIRNRKVLELLIERATK